MENNTNFIDKKPPFDIDKMMNAANKFNNITTQELIDELKTREDAGQFVDEETKVNLHKLIEALTEGEGWSDTVEDALAALDNCRDFTEFNKHYK